MSVASDKVKHLFLAAAELTALPERAAFLDQACGDDTMLRQRIEQLLQAHDQPEDFLDQPPISQAGPETLAGADTLLSFLAPSRKEGSLGRLGHYEVLEVIGKGGMGIVLRAFDEKLHRVVAIKALAPQLATTGSARQRFVREARAAAAVTHDNVIAIHGVEDDGPVPYLVMQCVDGKTLQEKIDRKGPLEVAEVLRIGLQVADGLAAAHRHGLVHRDVKPANILLENSVERVKITDFGLARAVDDASLTQSGLIAGTPMYMSPEQANGDRIDPRSDLFSLGSVMYAMCCGHPPFRANSTPAVLKRVASDPPRPLREINPAVPDWLAEIIDTLMAKSPDHRIQTASELASLLGEHLAHLQGKGPPPALKRPAKPSPSRGKQRKIVLGAVAVTVVGTLAVLSIARPWTRDSAEGVSETPVLTAGPAVVPVPQPTPFVNIGPALSASSLIDPLELARRPAAADALEPKNIPAELRKAAFGDDPKAVPPEVVAILGEDISKARGKSGCQLFTLAFSPDGKLLATGEGNRVIRLWDMATGKVKRELTGFDRSSPFRIYHLVFSPDGRRLAAVDWMGDLKLWELDTDKEPVTLAPPGRRVNQLAFSPDSRWLAVARSIGDVQLFDVTKRELEKTILGLGGEAWCVTFTPDSMTLAAGVSQNVRFWDVRSGKRNSIQLHAPDMVRWIGFHPAGNPLATAGTTRPGFNLGIQLWEITTFARVFRELDGHTSTVLTGAWRADGKMLVTAGETDGSVRVWDLTDNAMRGKAFKVVPPKLQWLHAIALSPEGRYLAVSHPDGMIIILRLAKQGELFRVAKP